jgi:hypothetical protein
MPAGYAENELVERGSGKQRLVCQPPTECGARRQGSGGLVPSEQAALSALGGCNLWPRLGLVSIQ